MDRFASGEINLTVPDLYWPEMGNILRKSVRVGRISEKSAYEALEWLHALEIPVVPTMPLVEDALRIAVLFDRTVYDSLYLALATASQPLVTADERLANAVAAHLPGRWLGAVA